MLNLIKFAQLYVFPLPESRNDLEAEIKHTLCHTLYCYYYILLDLGLFLSVCNVLYFVVFLSVFAPL